MRKTLALLLLFCVSSIVPSRWTLAAAQDQNQDQDQNQYQNQDQNQNQNQDQSQNQGSYFDNDQLDNLVAPVALYPDPLLAQVLVAATFPDQIDEADREMRGSGDRYDIDDAPWDVSVKAVAHYPSVLHMMASKIDWTTSLGQAYVSQSTDVMNAVQRLRAHARDAGYLATNPQQEVVYNDGLIAIYPAQPRYIYVPVYDPAVVYVRRPGFFGGAVITFGAGFAIGAWLNHDCDWRGHRVFYHGWDRNDGERGGWMERSRPFVRVTNVYVNNNYRTVIVNRTVVNRTVNYRELNHYNSVHRDVDYSHVRENRFDGRTTRDDRNHDDHRNPNQDHGYDVNNRTINRNINTNDSRIDANRGHWQGSNQNDAHQQQLQQQQQQQQRQAQLQQQQRLQQQQSQQQQQIQQQQRQQQFQQQQNHSVFQGALNGNEAHQASQRGQQSRQQNTQPVQQQQHQQQQQQSHTTNNQQSSHGGHDNEKHK